MNVLKNRFSHKRMKGLNKIFAPILLSTLIFDFDREREDTKQSVLSKASGRPSIHWFIRSVSHIITWQLHSK